MTLPDYRYTGISPFLFMKAQLHLGNAQGIANNHAKYVTS